MNGTLKKREVVVICLAGAFSLPTMFIFFGTKYHDTWGQFGICIAVTMMCLFGLGAQQGMILKQSVPRQAAFMMLNGGLAASASFLVSWGLQRAIGAAEC